MVVFTPACGTFGCTAATIPTIGNKEFNMFEVSYKTLFLEMRLIILVLRSSLAALMTISICGLMSPPRSLKKLSMRWTC